MDYLPNGAVFTSEAAMRSPSHPPQLKEVGKDKGKLIYLNKGYTMSNWQDIYEILMLKDCPVQSLGLALAGEGGLIFCKQLAIGRLLRAARPKEAGPVAA